MPFYLFRRIIRKLPGVVIKVIPKPEPVMTDDYGSREKIGEICGDAGYKSALLITDKTVYALGYHKKILNSLKANNIECTVFNNITSEPTIDIISEGRTAAINCGADCRFSKETDDEVAAVDKLIAALEELMKTCGLERGCDLIDEKDYKKLTNMINADAINYSPSKTLSNKEIVGLIDEIRKGR